MESISKGRDRERGQGARGETGSEASLPASPPRSLPHNRWWGLCGVHKQAPSLPASPLAPCLAPLLPASYYVITGGGDSVVSISKGRDRERGQGAREPRQGARPGSERPGARPRSLPRSLAPCLAPLLPCPILCHNRWWGLCGVHKQGARQGARPGSEGARGETGSEARERGGETGSEASLPASPPRPLAPLPHIMS